MFDYSSFFLFFSLATQLQVTEKPLIGREEGMGEKEKIRGRK